MKLKRLLSKIVACAVMSLMLFTSVTWGQEKVTADEARAIAKEAYIFNYPLVMYKKW